MALAIEFCSSDFDSALADPFETRDAAVAAAAEVVGTVAVLPEIELPQKNFEL